MKYANKLLTISAVLCLLLTVSCKKKDPIPEPPVSSEIPGAAISGTWAADSEDDIAYDGANPNVKKDFSNFKLTITADTSAVKYTSTSVQDKVFPTAGTLEGITKTSNFKADAGADVTRQPDNISTNIKLSGDGKTLTLGFAIPETTTTRTSGVGGTYTFTLSKQ